ncbi:hypothetical protein E2562_008235 [Oryza meyeriana var. granulata]|uniref:Glycosyl hydrolase family 13 catalytic domain-containing protein n=1 Tax=Oryza meyeriana var. granulata TaxID=110450 RepID=A0A6G1DFT4_9ORYZ|nr:hypothetical protein E2562_008235 [Oryza meyeriana var. granulata]
MAVDNTLHILNNLFWGHGVLQGFNWESWHQSEGWYNLLMGKVDDIAAAGVTHVWLPPPSHSVSTKGRSPAPPPPPCLNLTLNIWNTGNVEWTAR